MDDRTEQMDDLQLVAMPSAVGCAEMFVRFSLTEWSLRPLRDVAGEAVRRMTEAVVNTADPGTPGMMVARVRLTGGNLVLEIESPRPCLRVPEAPMGGRSGEDAVGPGQYVLWLTIPLPGGMDATSVPLPRRQRRPSPEAARLAAEEQAGAPADPDVLGRILFGLNRHEK